MKTLLFFFTLVPTALFGCSKSQPDNSDLPAIKQSLDTSGMSYIISKNDAEKILGQPVKLIDEKDEIKNGVVKKEAAYTGLKVDAGSDRSVNLYCSLEIYADSVSAKTEYTSILSRNSTMPGQGRVNGIGTEAWYHSDNENFGLMIVRKNEKLLRVKINKLSAKFSTHELQNIAKRIMK